MTNKLIASHHVDVVFVSLDDLSLQSVSPSHLARLSPSLLMKEEVNGNLCSLKLTLNTIGYLTWVLQGLMR